MAERLIRRVCDHCKIQTSVKDDPKYKYAKESFRNFEKEALKKEVENDNGDGKNIKNRIKEIDKEIGNLQEKTKELELKWQNEKGAPSPYPQRDRQAPPGIRANGAP